MSVFVAKHRAWKAVDTHLCTWNIYDQTWTSKVEILWPIFTEPDVTTVALIRLNSSFQLTQQEIITITRRNNYHMSEHNHVPRRPCYPYKLIPRLVIGKLIFGNLPPKSNTASLPSEANVCMVFLPWLLKYSWTIKPTVVAIIIHNHF